MIDVVAAFDELERRRREEAAALREWLVRVIARQDSPLSSGALSGGAVGAHVGVDDRELLDKGTVARRLGLSRRSVERRIRSGVLPAVREGGSVRVRRCDLDAYVARLRGV